MPAGANPLRFPMVLPAFPQAYPQACSQLVRAVPPNVLEKIVAKVPVGRLGRADEIARGVVFLTDEDAGFVTGSTLSINGGQHMY